MSARGKVERIPVFNHALVDMRPRMLSAKAFGVIREADVRRQLQRKRTG
jgi:hypothetical protein